MKTLNIICLVLFVFVNSARAENYVVLDEITQSCILDSNVIYYVQYPPLLIHGDIDVVIPSNTMIVIAKDFGNDYPAILVDSNANIYTGDLIAGTDNMASPVWIVGEDPNVFYNNDYGIVIDRTAGKKSILNNIYLSGFYYGLMIDQQLENPISNIYVFGCYNGIVSFGENQIINSYVSYFGSDGGYGGSAYCFFPWNMDDPPTIFFPNCNFVIENCLADDGDYGFETYCLDAQNAPTFSSRDCVATNCYSYGFAGWDGGYGAYTNFSIICPGLYNNTQNNNLDDSVFTDPVYETNDPLVFDSNDYRIFLNPNSSFVNHGSGLSPLLGWTTRLDGIPDSNIGDIWPHYQNSSNPISADLNADGVVDANDLFEFANYWLVESNRKIDLDNSGYIDFGDLFVIAENWLQENPNNGNLNNDNIVNFLDFAELAKYWNTPVVDPISVDFNKDGIVNFTDYATLANQWMLSEIFIEISDLETNQVISIDNVKGYVGISVRNIPLTAQMISVYLDNLLIGQVQFGLDDEKNWVGLQSDRFFNGLHTISLASMDIYGNVVNHAPTKVYFNNLLYKVTGEDKFHPSEDYHFSGFYDGSKNLETKLINSMNNQIIWSNTYSGKHIDISIPGSTFNSMQFCQLYISEVIGLKSLGVIALGGSGDPGVSTTELTKEFRQSDCPAGVRMVIVMPNKDVYKCRKPAIIACAQACNNKNVSWVPLYYGNVTQENLTFLYNKSSVKFVYWCGHANSYVGRNENLGIEGVPRTNTICWKIKKGWIWDSYDEQGVFSWTNGTVPLPNDWDSKGFSLWDLGMHDSWDKKIVFVDGCLSAVFADMASAYGMFSEQGYGSNDQIYIGWRIKVLTAPEGTIWNPLLPSTEAVKKFWEKMGQGNYSVYQAFEYVQAQGGGVRRAFWGLNGMMDLDEPYETSDDNIWIYGFPGGIDTKLEP